MTESPSPVTAAIAVMSLVIRVERESPPDRTDALEAVAAVVLRVWSELAVAQHEQLMAAWMASPRIVVRRARAASWRRVASMRAVHVRLRTAEVIGFPISWTDEVPNVIARLPVAGTELHDGSNSSSLPAAPGSATLHLNPTLNMSAGKQMAQVGHGALALLEWLPEVARRAWAGASYPLVVRVADSPTWRRLLGAGLPEIRDAGHTEIARGSLTVIAEYTRPWPNA